MSHDADPDPRFALLRSALSAGPRHDDAPGDEGISAQASVSVVLRAAPSLEVLLIKRAESAGDPWSGQMALPGGRRDAGDSTLLATAIRETAEETAVVLAESDHYLGALDYAAPWTSRIPRMTIHPFVFGVPGPTRAVPDGREVESTHWASVAALRDPANADMVEWTTPSGRRTFPGFRVDGHVVWGLTYRILIGFLERVPDDLS
ncbi:MAG: CoA pyrophosphatase [Gemmatimonadota bacterium]|nr:MAG: CoA pyrophosphatase [Gemmatimonadota bacterium]